MQSALAPITFPAAVIDMPIPEVDPPVDPLGPTFAEAVLADPSPGPADKTPPDPLSLIGWVGPVPVVPMVLPAPPRDEPPSDLTALDSWPLPDASRPETPLASPPSGVDPGLAVSNVDTDLAAAAPFLPTDLEPEAARPRSPTAAASDDRDDQGQMGSLVPSKAASATLIPAELTAQGAEDASGPRTSDLVPSFAALAPQATPPDTPALSVQAPGAMARQPAGGLGPSPLPDHPTGIDPKPQPVHTADNSGSTLPPARVSPLEAPPDIHLPEGLSSPIAGARTDAPPPPKSSFWERAFAGLAVPAPLTVPLAVPVVIPHAIDQAPVVAVIPPAFAVPTDADLADPDPALPVPPRGQVLPSAMAPVAAAFDPNAQMAPAKRKADPRSTDAMASAAPTRQAAALPPVTAPSATPVTGPPPQVILSAWDQGPDAANDITLPYQPIAMAASTALPAAAHPTQQSLPVPHVAAQIAGVLVSRTDEATELALAPEELGRVKLRMKPDPGNPDRMVILISVERPETLDLFRRHAGDLAEAIRAAGYSGADIGFGQQGQGQDRPRQPLPGAFDFGPGLDDPAPTHTAPRMVSGTNLDLRL